MSFGVTGQWVLCEVREYLGSWFFGGLGRYFCVAGGVSEPGAARTLEKNMCFSKTPMFGTFGQQKNETFIPGPD